MEVIDKNLFESHFEMTDQGVAEKKISVTDRKKLYVGSVMKSLRSKKSNLH